MLKLFVKLKVVKKYLNASYQEALQKDDHNLISSIIEEENSKSFPYSKQESLTKNVIGFVIGIMQFLSIIEDKDFIKMINEFDLYYKVLISKLLKIKFHQYMKQE
ncbi:13981_t:CDS:2 [Funneliformis geosporum]|uniref:18735_t:CDS:1 n=1 Tax=Funneliformis geosporum TaxID=1117311 RepID=A0A9W4SSL0_9GLOM|nr:13981_t:CDS:2 [Funneliformis geosporum]CAI2179025.1 18735_t:CDS:2 [Funneliformis geosporum]